MVATRRRKADRGLLDMVVAPSRAPPRWPEPPLGLQAEPSQSLGGARVLEGRADLLFSKERAFWGEEGSEPEGVP